MLKDAKKTKEKLVTWIREYFEENGPGCSAIIGISGGKDSSVCAALCAEALGKERVIGVLMPNGVQSDISDSRALVESIQIPHVEMNIGKAFDAMAEMVGGNAELEAITGQHGISSDTRINMPPRLRMTTLYAVAQMVPGGARVCNTCNMSEDYVGYSTKYGDAAGDFSPLAGLLVDEVLQIGAELGLPEFLVKKAPSDGLSGQTDEDKLGFTYDTLGAYVRTGKCDDEETKKKIDRLHRLNLHKLKTIPKFEPEEVERTLKLLEE